MFSGKKKKDLWDYVEAHNPYNSIETMIRPAYAEGVASVEHKELEEDIAEYWDLLHPLTCDFINSYALTVQKMQKQFVQSREDVEAARRALTFEQQNVQDQSDEIRELKGLLQGETVKARDLEERLKDETDALRAQFDQEKRALEVVANSKLQGMTMKDVISQLNEGGASSADSKRLQDKVTELETKINREREENERIQGELSTSFMEKITRYDEMIRNLKQRLGED